MGYVYDLSGRWIMELAIDSAGPCNYEIYAGGRHLAHSGGTTNFSHSDWLGTERLRTQNINPNAGPWVACESIASLPFGDGQVTTPLYGSGCYHDSRMHFTGKERDAATGLDNFGARFDSSQFGRFTSPDWSPSPTDVPYADFGNPQSLNVYSYVKNNPMTFTDPDGHCTFEGKEHGSVWCWLHSHGFFETKAETSARAKREAEAALARYRRFLANNPESKLSFTQYQIAFALFTTLPGPMEISAVGGAAEAGAFSVLTGRIVEQDGNVARLVISGAKGEIEVVTEWPKTVEDSS